MEENRKNQAQELSGDALDNVAGGGQITLVSPTFPGVEFDAPEHADANKN